MLVSADDCFGEEFFRDVEIEFSEILREPTDFPFAHLINLQVQTDEMVRDIAMTYILDRLGVQADNEDEFPGVTVYVVSGGGLTSQPDLVLEGLRECCKLWSKKGTPRSSGTRKSAK